MTNYLVYIATFRNGKKYVGLTSQGLHVRKNRHISESNRKTKTLFHKALKKYNFDCIWEVYKEGLTKSEACSLEMELISRFNSNNYSYGYNLTKGGQSTLHNAETLKKIGKANSIPFYICTLEGAIIEQCPNQYYVSDKYNIKQGCVSKCLKGKAFSAKKYRFRYLDSDFIFNSKTRTTPRYTRPKGYRHSQETIEKMKINRKPMTDAQKDILRENAKKRIGIKLGKMNEDRVIQMARIRMKYRIKAVRNGTEHIFLSLKECCDSLNLKKHSVTAVLANKRTSIFGYNISYVKEI